MNKDHDHRFQLLRPYASHATSITRRLLAVGLGRRYAGRARESFAPAADVPSLVGCLDALIEQSQMIKVGDNIDVARTRWANHDIVIKRFRHVSLVHSIRHAIKKSRARRAWANGHHLRRLDIPTPPPLAYVDEYRGPLLWQSFLITAYAEGQNLYSFLRDAGVPDGRKRRLVHQILRLIDRLGSHGVSHGDMKHTNILWDGVKIVLTDLDGMEIHRLAWLHRQRRAKDIARFLRNMPWPEKAQDAPCAEDSWRNWKGNHDFVRIAGDGGTLYVNQAYRNKTLEDALGRGQHILGERFRAEPVKSAGSSHVCRFRVAFQGVEKQVYVKTYLDRSIVDWLKHHLRPSRALRAMRGSLMLARHGLLAAEIVAAGWTRDTSRKRRSLLATLNVAGGRSLYDYLAPRPGCPALCTYLERRQLLSALGRTVGRMHAAGIYHGDLRPGNVLVRCTEGRWEFFFIDNERTTKWPRLPRHLRLKNLVQINMLPQGLSNTDRWRFFQSYMLMNPSVRLRHKRWAEAIMRNTYRRLFGLKLQGRVDDISWPPAARNEPAE